MQFNPLNLADFYKTGHAEQYEPGTSEVLINFTARSALLSNLPVEARNGVVFYGEQFFSEYVLDTLWTITPAIMRQFERRWRLALNREPSPIIVESLKKIMVSGKLPIEICALPEGTLVPVGVPMLTIRNTEAHAFWLPNFLETVLSATLWKAITSATTARHYRQLCERWADVTCDTRDHIPFQCHDFSMRGMSGIEDATLSGSAHLLAFQGTDSIPALDFLEQYYDADANFEPLGFSVPATEHSVMCMGMPEGEFETFRRLITDVYPDGIVSIVSDTWDFWKVLTDFLPRLKDLITSRDGKVVIRPDSGDPVKIICGDPNAATGTPEHKGAIQCLWDVFGGTFNSKGYKVLHPTIGLIYGDSITPQRAEEILTQLAEKGFASSNVVFGVGSFTYQFVTRDTWGMAVKATHGVVNGEPRAIFKDPKTGGGKKSLRGLFTVRRDTAGKLFVKDGLDQPDPESLLRPVYRDGVRLRHESLAGIRARITTGLGK